MERLLPRGALPDACPTGTSPRGARSGAADGRGRDDAVAGLDAALRRGRGEAAGDAREVDAPLGAVRRVARVGTRHRVREAQVELRGTARRDLNPHVLSGL